MTGWEKQLKTMSEIQRTERSHKIREFLSRYIRDRNLRDEDDIFALGLVNSLVAMQLIQFVEREFGISVVDDDLSLDNFCSIERIDAFIESKGRDGS